MKLSSQTLFLVLLSAANTNFLQSLFGKNRDLSWVFGGEEINDDKFFSDYDQDEIPSDKKEYGDRIDYLRDGDVCAGPDGSLSRDNCLTPPDCSMSNDEVGEAMLCINRAAVPGDTSKWYVLAMKCIPIWENCDKCFCGYMKRSYAEDGFCRWDDSSANDDRVEYDCDDRTRATMMDMSFTLGEGLSTTSKGEKEGKGDKDKDRRVLAKVDAKSTGKVSKGVRRRH